jgi:methionyl-tRNA formyltransferase
MFAHVFRYTPGMDAGGILAAPLLALDDWDTIDTLQQKARVLFTQTVIDNWDSLLAGDVDLVEQKSREIDLEYPKRDADSGAVDWAWPTRHLFNWVRAQTRPYPGAYCRYKGKRHAIWAAVPFPFAAFPLPPAGTVTDRFHDGSYIVAVGDGFVHVRDHDLPRGIPIGDKIDNGR